MSFSPEIPKYYQNIKTLWGQSYCPVSTEAINYWHWHPYSHAFAQTDTKNFSESNFARFLNFSQNNLHRIVGQDKKWLKTKLI